MQHKEQRVLVLFDVQNLYYSAKHLYNTKVNFKEILKKAVSGRKLIRAIAYVIRADIKDESNFHEALNKVGIEVKAKDLQIFFGGAKKGDWDIGIAMDAVRLANKVDTVVLISGDGDFKDLAAYLKSHGCRTEAMAFSKTSSKHLKEEVDMFYDLDLDLKKFLIGTPKISSSPSPRKTDKTRNSDDKETKDDSKRKDSDDSQKRTARRPGRGPRKDAGRRYPRKSTSQRRTDRRAPRGPRNYPRDRSEDDFQNAVMQANLAQPDEVASKLAEKDSASIEVFDIEKNPDERNKSFTGTLKKLITKGKEE
jgi:uncharacterized LabA/DUF88 family protein